MRPISFLTAVPVGLVCCLSAAAGESRAPNAKPVRTTAVQPNAGAVRLHGVRWHHNLADARKAAAATRARKARPVLWLRMLGDLTAKT